VYQRSTIIPQLTVAENVYLNRHAARGGGLGRRLISWSELRRRARDLLQTWEVDVDVNTLAGALSVEQRQLVEIARALSFDARFIILDEPTAQLDAPAISRLFERMRGLQERGVTFLYISHHLEEIYRICDDVTVFRDAQRVATGLVAEMEPREVVAAMTGDAVALIQRAPRPPVPASVPVVLSVRDVEVTAAEGTFEDAQSISFEVRTGEVVGLAGGGGSGKREMAEAIVGLRPHSGGTVSVDGRVLPSGSVKASLGDPPRHPRCVGAQADRGPGRQDARPGAGRGRTVRRQPAEGGDGPCAGQRPAPARVDPADGRGGRPLEGDAAERRGPGAGDRVGGARRL
jgi:simple sugar transport system ATP-binding protein